MTELELDVEDTRGKQRVHTRRTQPLEEASHDLGDVGCRSPRMNESIPVEHADIARSKTPSVRDETTHHHAVNAQQIRQRMRIELRNQVVGGARVFDFEDVAPVSKNPLSVDNRAHRALIESVTFDDERGVDRLDPQLPTQCRAGRQWGLRRQHADELSDLHAERINHVGAFERRFVGHDHLLLPPQLYRHWR